MNTRDPFRDMYSRCAVSREAGALWFVFEASSDGIHPSCDRPLPAPGKDAPLIRHAVGTHIQ